MIKKMRTNQKGFTLIELMIVVAIIGILAAIAIPNFMQYQLKSKAAEAKSNLGAIRSAQEAYRAEKDTYIVCGQYPDVAKIGVPKQAWVAADATTAKGWDEIGFAPSGDVYYSYIVANGTATIATTFKGTATGDLDGDTKPGVFTINQAGALLQTSTAGLY